MFDNKASKWLDALSGQILNLLAGSLPRLSERWWQEKVVDQLTFQQQQHVRTSRITELHQLDLAALLRVLDQNWYELSSQMDWPKNARNWLKEAQTIRNRWAHAPTTGLNDADVYRDLDTIERLMAMLGAEQETLAMLRQQKSSFMLSIAGHPTSAPNLAPVQAAQTSAFGKGALVWRPQRC